MAQKVKVVGVKSEDLSSIFRTHMVEDQADSSILPTHRDTQSALTHISHVHTLLIKKLKTQQNN